MAIELSTAFNERRLGVVQGLALTLVLAVLARSLAAYPLLSIAGSMVLAIIAGMAWRAVMGMPLAAGVGVDFAAKRLLRLGIILMGLRLNIHQIAAAGPKVILLDALVITFTLIALYFIGRKLSLGRRMAALIAVGTGVCGAAAIAAAAPAVRAKDDETAVSVAIIAILGTVFTLAYTALHPFLSLNPYQYGVFSGATLHELAHVIAASQAGGAVSMDTALLVKLGRVALLAPVVIILDYIFCGRQSLGQRSLPVPWFILGFLGMSLVNTLGLFSATVQAALVQASVFLLTMAMAGLGLSVRLDTLKRTGLRGLGACLAGTAALSLFGAALLQLLKF